MTQVPFADRLPTPAEVERIRLILSTYQDGSGQEADGTLPGWRDFERTIAAAFGGRAPHDKSIFDVLLRPSDPSGKPLYGLSCKMRGQLDRVARDDRVTIEASNAGKQFWDALGDRGVSRAELRNQAALAGAELLALVTRWHELHDHRKAGLVDIEKSSYLVLLWNAVPEYQLFQFRLSLFDPATLAWSVRNNPRRPDGVGTLCGRDESGVAVEWCGDAGGQLKLYPFAKDAIWRSERFGLEALPAGTQNILEKAETYFPDRWRAAEP